ncbi:MAG: hormogonium polysaccharide biosynthesis protein HpsA [Synechococcales bacterium]|nr:hormogonium polysaccharide biosynthesis protein HpsA [Synechococcales bacterium]
MANRTFSRAARRFFKDVFRLPKQSLNSLVRWLLRGLLLVGRRPTSPVAGFVLPTTVLLLLVVSLAVGAITLRTYNRTLATVGDRQQRVIYNAATPAIDRAKAKLEFLFSKDPRLPSGVPGEGALKNMLSDGTNIASGVTTDAYTFPGETPLDLNNDNTDDVAWSYRADSDGDGTEDATVAYSILFETPDDSETHRMSNSTDAAVATRAANMQVRHGPLSSSSSANSSCSYTDEAGVTQALGVLEDGWFEDLASTSVLRKNFQVNVFVLPDNANGTVSTLEFHQDRQMERGNKWGAWFRNDIEIHPGQDFNWNGAMHTEGSFLAKDVVAFQISSPASCLFSRDASEITVADTQADATNNIPAFQGQFFVGELRDNTYEGGSKYDLYPTGQYKLEVKSNVDKDSIDAPANTKISAFTLDPIVLFTDNVSQARGLGSVDGVPVDPKTHRDVDFWESDANKAFKELRLYNKSEETPYVDDSFRADNRYGPGARVQGKRIPDKIGEPIDGDQLDSGDPAIKDIILTRDVPEANDAEKENLGLDGYWERRARNHGLRVIVGERLELGNAFGWGDAIENVDGLYVDSVEYDSAKAMEPLFPFDVCTSPTNTTGSLINQTTGTGGRCHEARQRRTLYDNLAAVQAAVFYHAGQSGISSSAADSWHDFPTACMASTVHPGTADTLINSSIYHELKTGIEAFWTNSTIYKTSPVVSNFLWGQGTNGWEYNPAPPGVTNETTFAAAIAANQPLGQALRNLAHFAGDPFGGTPSFTPTDNTASGAKVHPYPLLSMWGDFSMLRRILAMIDGLPGSQGNPLDDADVSTTDSVAYDQLSPADKATIHSAACMLGMLAYNIGFLEKFEYSQGAAQLTALEAVLKKIYDRSTDVPTTARLRNNARPEIPEGFLYVLKKWNEVDTDANADGQKDNVPDYMIPLAETIILKEQVIRDRQYGFTKNKSPNAAGGTAMVFDLGAVGSGRLEDLTTDIPKFPALRYIFPGDRRSPSTSNPDGIITADDNFTEETNSATYEDKWGSVRDAYIANTLNPTTGTNKWEYVAIDLRDETVLNKVAVYPKAVSSWVLPKVADGEGTTTLSETKDKVLIGCSDNLCTGTAPSAGKYRLLQVGFKDAALYNGREMMLARVMDFNLGLLRTTGTGLTSSEKWLPLTGIVYAFREDAVREDEINRPAQTGATWATCGNDAALSNPSATETKCLMNAGGNALDSTDPPLNSANFISPKPVDYYPDPDRRVHGFRLRNGETVKRAGDNGRGLSFISDNPAYLMGHFNLHKKPGCTTYDPNSTDCQLEEFQSEDYLNPTWANFYSRTKLDPNFARPSKDDWRPTEIFADAITVLSNEFCEGSIEDGYLNINSTVDNATYAKYGCSGGTKLTSFLNQIQIEDLPGNANLVIGGSTRWQRVSPFDLGSPISVDNNGNPVKGNTSYFNGSNHQYREAKRNERKTDQINTGTRVNSILVSGIVPSRAGQPYGGLHNFPRFNEFWNSASDQVKPSFISGSLLQLQFSKYATAPFDQDAWEPGQQPIEGKTVNTEEFIPYYRAPDRRWGYDVALQYAPAGPMAKRFVSSSASPRSEFYSEPPADDPYVAQLCRSIVPDDEEATRCP